MFDLRISRITQNRRQFFVISNAVMILEILIRQLFFLLPSATLDRHSYLKIYFGTQVRTASGNDRISEPQLPGTRIVSHSLRSVCVLRAFVVKKNLWDAPVSQFDPACEFLCVLRVFVVKKISGTHLCHTLTQPVNFFVPFVHLW